jgi:hypothetical protein
MTVVGVGLRLLTRGLGAAYDVNVNGKGPNQWLAEDEEGADIRMRKQLITASILFVFAGCGHPQQKFDSLIQDLQTGKLDSSKDSRVRLPVAYTNLTPKSEIFVERRPDGRLFVLFPTWYGRGDDMDGWLYCSGYLQQSDYYTVDWGTGGKHRHIDVAGRKMLTVTSDRPHWYRFTRRLD